MFNFQIPEPIDTIASKDGMFVEENRQHYFKVGSSALINIIHTMFMAGMNIKTGMAFP